MSGIGDLRNSIESLKRTVIRNNILEKMHLSPHHFEEEFLKANNPGIFLKMVNYIMIEHSSVLEKAIVTKFPNIRAQSDKIFMERCYVLIRQLFNTFPSLTIDQFFSNRFLELKVKFIDELVNLVLFWINKSPKQTAIKAKQGKQEKVYTKKLEKYDQDQEPRKISIKPASFNKQQNRQINRMTQDIENPISLNFKPHYSQRPKYSQYQEQQSSMLSKPLPKYLDQNPQPIKLKPTTFYEQQQSLTYNLQPQQDKQQSQSKKSSPSTQNQINDLYQLLGNVSVTVNQLVGKFNDFQQNVSSWVKNINAKVDVLDNKVKTIQANL